jgi:hypothetical protein
LTTGTGRGPQPSSAGGNSAAQPQREGRNELHGEGGRVIVVDDDCHIRLGLRHPFLGFLETAEYPLPVGLLGLAVVERRTDGGNVGRAYTCDDCCHGSLPLC